MNILSKPTFLGGFTLIVLLNIFFTSIALLSLLSGLKLINFWLFSVFGVIEIILFIELVTRNRYLTLFKDKIILTNPIFFTSKEILWSDLDYVLEGKEQSPYARYKTLWLIKNGKPIIKISSFYYSNFEELKKHIPIKITKTSKE